MLGRKKRVKKSTLTPGHCLAKEIAIHMIPTGHTTSHLMIDTSQKITDVAKEVLRMTPSLTTSLVGTSHLTRECSWEEALLSNILEVLLLATTEDHHQGTSLEHPGEIQEDLLEAIQEANLMYLIDLGSILETVNSEWTNSETILLKNKKIIKRIELRGTPETNLKNEVSFAFDRQ